MVFQTAAVAAVLGGLAGVAKAVTASSKDSKRSNKKLVNFEDLLREQRTVDRADASEILKNFHALETQGEWIIAKPTKKVAKQFGITNLPPQIDPERNLLQLVTDKRGDILKGMLISFGELDEGLKKILPFGTKDFVLIEKGGK